MSREAGVAFGLLLVSLLSSCIGSGPIRPLETAPQPQVMSDTFFSGCAYLDEDANGAIESTEPLLGGMTFTVTLATGGGFGADTPEGKCAFITVPGSLQPEAWPVLARMVAPDGAAYEGIGPSEITLENPHTRADFLFTPK
jgi:hypothetical protein